MVEHPFLYHCVRWECDKHWHPTVPYRALEFLRFLRAFGNGVPLILIDTVREGKLDWGSDGNLSTRKLPPENFPSRLYDILTSKQLRGWMIDYLKAARMIEVRDLQIHLRKSCIDKFVPSHGAKGLAAFVQAATLLCHRFPAHPFVDSAFGHIGRQLLYAVQRLVEWASDRHIIQHLTPIREDFLRMLLASSYFRDLQWKTQVLDLAMKMGAYSDPYLRAHMDLRMQIVYGRKICGPYLGVDSANVCANMMTAQKSIRSANDCLLVSEFARATRLLSRVEAPLSDKKDLAKFELCVLQQSQCTRARIECFLNRPQSAIDLVSSLKPDSGPAALLFDCDQTIIIARARCQLGHTDDAINLLREELNAQSELRRQNLHRVGKLKTLLGEMYTLQGDRKRAEDCFQEFPDNRFQEHPDSGSLTTNARVIARITQFQAVICRAILAHKACCWPEARQRWVQVRSLLQKYQWSSNFLHAIVQISLARVAQVCPSPDTYQQGGVYTAENTRDQIFDDRHVFVVLSHWFDEIRR